MLTGTHSDADAHAVQQELLRRKSEASCLVDDT